MTQRAGFGQNRQSFGDGPSQFSPGYQHAQFQAQGQACRKAFETGEPEDELAMQRHFSSLKPKSRISPRSLKSQISPKSDKAAQAIADARVRKKAARYKPKKTERNNRRPSANQGGAQNHHQTSQGLNSPTNYQTLQSMSADPAQKIPYYLRRDKQFFEKCQDDGDKKIMTLQISKISEI